MILINLTDDLVMHIMKESEMSVKKIRLKIIKLMGKNYQVAKSLH